VIIPASGRVGGAGACPTIGARIISPARIEDRWSRSKTAPDDHFTAGPDCGVNIPSRWRVDGARRCPTARTISPAGVEIIAAGASAPNDHFTAGPDCGVFKSRKGGIDGAGWNPAIGDRIIHAAGIRIS
jgi:hypothetical protein